MPSIKTRAQAAATKHPVPKTDMRKARARKLKKDMAAASRRQQVFPFLDLPAELRNEIYRYALTDDIIEVKADDSGDVSRVVQARDRSTPLNFGLLLTNRQISNEARHILYTENVFNMHEPGTLADFAHNIGSNASLIHTIMFDIPKIRGIPLIRGRFRALESGANLTKVGLDITYDRICPYTLAARFYNAARAWIDLVAERDGNKTAVLDMIGLFGRETLPDKTPDPPPSTPWTRQRAFDSWEKLEGAFRRHLTRCINRGEAITNPSYAMMQTEKDGKDPTYPLDAPSYD